MRMVDLIDAKRTGGVLTAEQIDYIVRGYTAGEIPDYQMAAFFMAVCWRGMTPEETVAMTLSMAASGDQLDLSRFGGAAVDKHSTGGVGDKTTLVVAPLAAALGGRVAKLSGRGLGFTGGTLDKLEAIPGCSVNLSPAAFLEQVERVGCAVTGQTGDLAPADKAMYALRDVTATVQSVPLIAASIMSKKLAAGAGTIVLDVKVGSGAFMQTEEEALALARAMVALGKAAGRRTIALLTGMDQPLGAAVGNATEVAEAVATLQGKGPDDLTELCLTLAARMVSLGLERPYADMRRAAEQALQNGAAYEKFRQWIAAQGGDLSQPLPAAAYQMAVPAPTDGVITAMDTRAIGAAAALLGAGRAKKGDTVDPAAGLIVLRKIGDDCTRGEPVAMLYANRKEALPVAAEAYAAALSIGDAPVAPPPLIRQVVE